MSKEILATAYDSWVASEDYKIQSAMENGFVNQKAQEVVSITEPEDTVEVLDHIMHIACETEVSAFEQGFRRGILFMMEMKHGGACHA